MFLDAQAQLSDSQALSGSAASTNVIDLGADGNVGIGEPMAVLVVVEVAADFTTTDETYVVDLETDDNSGFSSATNLGQLTLPDGAAAGSRFVIGVPADSRAEQFLRLNYTLGGTTPSVTLSAYLQPQSMIQNDVVYPDGFTIS
jgi:hypothetical protein